ncbi:YkgJ family cysteine cluster protein [Pseudonocardia kongjuensis]
MRTDRAAAVAELQRIYDDLPAVACKGRCADACTSIDMSGLERQRIRDRGVEIAPRLPVHELTTLDRFDRVPRCAALTVLNTCSVYEVRPLICRLFGAARGLRCEHGCVPDRELTDPEAFKLIAQVTELSKEAGL